MSEERSIAPVWEFLVAVCAAMGLTKVQFKLLIRILWVMIVTTHILWVCGLLASFGLASPFASAGEVEELHRATLLSAKLQLTQELRVQTIYLCSAKDDYDRRSVEQTMERLKDEYVRVTKGEMPPEFKCPEKKL